MRLLKILLGLIALPLVSIGLILGFFAVAFDYSIKTLEYLGGWISGGRL